MQLASSYISSVIHLVKLIHRKLLLEVPLVDEKLKQSYLLISEEYPGLIQKIQIRGNRKPVKVWLVGLMQLYLTQLDERLMIQLNTKPTLKNILTYFQILFVLNGLSGKAEQFQNYKSIRPFCKVIFSSENQLLTYFIQSLIEIPLLLAQQLLARSSNYAQTDLQSLLKEALNRVEKFNPPQSALKQFKSQQQLQLITQKPFVHELLPRPKKQIKRQRVLSKQPAKSVIRPKNHQSAGSVDRLQKQTISKATLEPIHQKKSQAATISDKSSRTVKTIETSKTLQSNKLSVQHVKETSIANPYRLQMNRCKSGVQHYRNIKKPYLFWESRVIRDSVLQNNLHQNKQNLLVQMQRRNQTTLKAIRRWQKILMEKNRAY